MTATQLRHEAEAIADATPDVTMPTIDQVWADLAKLREPFDSSQVGLLPKPYKSDSPKGNCAECGKYHGLPAMHLDFVGHGAVTERLLDVDLFWNWEPFAVDATGLPALDRHGNLWIRLTVCGVTRIGVGDGATMKVLIGDAIRNAAMRFGVALYLWVRGQEDEKQHDGEKMPSGPPLLDKDAALAVVKKQAEGDADRAKAAWIALALTTEWTEEALTAAYLAWTNEPPAEATDA